MGKKQFLMVFIFLMVIGGVGAERFGDGIDVNVERDYSTIIIPEGGVTHFDIKISNNKSEPINLETELSSVDSQFTSNGGNSKRYTVPPKDEVTYRVQLSPKVSTEGLKNLEISTTNLNTSLEKSFEFPVYVRNPPKTQSLELPATSSLAVLILFVSAILFFTGRRSFYS